ncbi:beta-defensin 106A-like [Nycticebus coucang]|uniref:beta-defensin 106A-like n=1 Tax=Nycticebus coucang TaxID=9470 RepID=UPI00234C067A|nr:beta-defensin 106A-like [Nycticebus coucang]
MKIFIFFFAVLLFLAPAKNSFFDEKCLKLKGRCVNYCEKNEELVALCQKSLRCCVTLQPSPSQSDVVCPDIMPLGE